MITTTYKCDRCGHEQANATQMWDIRVQYAGADTPHYSTLSRYTQHGEQMWCRKCFEAVGIFRGKAPEGAPPAPPPSFEDLVRELIREEVREAIREGGGA